MKKLIVILNDLENSGKTSVSRALGCFLREKEITHTIVTTDERDIDDHFAGEYWDFEDEFEIAPLTGAMERHDTVILDLHTGAARVWNEFCDENKLEDTLAEMDADVALLIPEHGSERCHDEVSDLAEIFSDRADYIVASLPIPARRSAPSDWNHSYAKKATTYLGASFTELPGFSAELQTALETHDLSLAQAINQLENLPRFVEVELMQWIEAANESFEKCSDYLIPEQSDGLVMA